MIRRCPRVRPDLFRTVRDLGLVSPGCPCGSGASEGCSSVWLPGWLPNPAGVYPGLAPSLLGGLAGDAETGADLGPGVAALAPALDCLGYGGVDLIGQTEYEGQGLNVAAADPAGAPLTGPSWRATQSEADEAPIEEMTCQDRYRPCMCQTAARAQ